MGDWDKGLATVLFLLRDFEAPDLILLRSFFIILSFHILGFNVFTRNQESVIKQQISIFNFELFCLLFLGLFLVMGGAIFKLATGFANRLKPL